MKPMKPSEFNILIALAAGPSHGLGIAVAVDEATQGMVRLGPATLYRALHNLAAGGLISETSAPPGEDDPRRRFYAITAEGRGRAAAEAERLRNVLDFAERNQVFGDRRG